MKIFISFGHYGKGTGARKGQYDEYLIAKEFAGLTLSKVAKRDAYMLKGNERDLKELVGNINKAKDIAVAVEFHLNSPGGTGSEVFVSPKTSKANRQRAAELSCIVSDTLGLTNRGVKTSDHTRYKRLAFVDDTDCPALLCELCFIDNEGDMDAFARNKERLAANVAEWLDTLI